MQPARERHVTSLAIRRLRAAGARAAKWLYRTGIRDPHQLTLPDFLGIGAPRSGTTWLGRNLREHPEIFFPERKELHYFDIQYGRPLRWYAHYFEAAGGYVKGEITPAYLYISPSRIRFIRQVVPDLKTVVLLRNPIERAWSDALRMKVKRPRVRYEDVSRDEMIELLISEKFMARNDYLSALRNWRTVLPPESMFIGFYEDVSARPQQLLSAIFEHLGVSTDVAWNEFPYARRFNKNKPAEMPPEIRTLLTDQYRDQIVGLQELFGDRVVHWHPA